MFIAHFMEVTVNKTNTCIRICGVFSAGMLQGLNRMNLKMRLWRVDQKTGAFLMLGSKDY